MCNIILYEELNMLNIDILGTGFGSEYLRIYKTVSDVNVL